MSARLCLLTTSLLLTLVLAAQADDTPEAAWARLLEASRSEDFREIYRACSPRNRERLLAWALPLAYSEGSLEETDPERDRMLSEHGMSGIGRRLYEDLLPVEEAFEMEKPKLRDGEGLFVRLLERARERSKASGGVARGIFQRVTQFPQGTFRDVAIDGDTATATLIELGSNGEEYRYQAWFVRLDGRWYVGK